MKKFYLKDVINLKQYLKDDLINKINIPLGIYKISEKLDLIIINWSTRPLNKTDYILYTRSTLYDINSAIEKIFN